MAEQSTSQQEEQRMVNTILANVGTVITFRSGNPADEMMILPLFSPYIQPGEIANLPTYNFYARLSAVYSQEPVSGETLLLDTKSNYSDADEVIEMSRQNWAKVENSNSPSDGKQGKKPKPDNDDELDADQHGMPKKR
jgi:hypothetical protein